MNKHLFPTRVSFFLSSPGIYCLTLLKALLLTGFNTQAQVFSGTLNNDAVQAEVIGRASRVEELSFSAGFYHHEENGQIVHLGFYVTEPQANQFAYPSWLGFNVGGKALMFDSDIGAGGEGGAVAFGGTAAMPLPFFRNLFLEVNAFYAPPVVAFEDADYYFEGSVRLLFEIMTPVDVFVGYRKISLGLVELPDVDLDDAIHVGAILKF